eukprot:1195714-Prorocentrum_minimum.AAC.2
MKFVASVHGTDYMGARFLSTSAISSPSVWDSSAELIAPNLCSVHDFQHHCCRCRISSFYHP